MAPPLAASKAAAPVISATAEAITAVVLAGGEGRRIGGNKPLRMLAGRPLLAHVLSALAPQASRLGIVARTEADAARLTALAAPYLAQDVATRVLPMGDRPDVEGPVAGLLGAAARTATPLLLTVPVDTPFLPADLTARLAGALADGVDAAVATDARAHPTIALCRARALRACSAAGSLRATLAPLQPAFVPFPAEVLVNINTAQDLTASEARLAPPLTRGAKGR